MSSRIDYPSQQTTPRTPWQSIPKAMQRIALKIEAICNSPRQTDLAKLLLRQGNGLELLVCNDLADKEGPRYQHRLSLNICQYMPGKYCVFLHYQAYSIAPSPSGLRLVPVTTMRPHNTGLPAPMRQEVLVLAGSQQSLLARLNQALQRPTTSSAFTQLDDFHRHLNGHIAEEVN